MIPQLDAHGLLPPGVHDCLLDEVAGVFGFNAHRLALLEQLRRFIAEQLLGAGLRCPIFIDGSFVRAKATPKDIDVVLELAGMTEVAAMTTALALRMRREQVLHEYHVDVWTRHPSFPIDLAAYFQYAGTSAAAELHIDSKHPKGILRIQP